MAAERTSLRRGVQRSRTGIEEFFECNRGVIWLSGSDVERAAEESEQVPRPFIAARQQRDGKEHHLTLLTPQETEGLIKATKGGSLSSQSLLDAAAKDCVDNWIDVGLGSASRGEDKVFFKVILWPGAYSFRKRHGLCNREFHITIGFKSGDIHDGGIDKGLGSLVKRRKDFSVEERRELVSHLIELADAAHAPETLLQRSLMYLDFAVGLIADMENENQADPKGKQKEDTATMSPEARVEVFNSRSLLFGRLGRFEECIADAEVAIKLQPNSLTGYARRGAGFYHSKGFGEALGSFRRGLATFEATAKGSSSSTASKDVEYMKRGLERSLDQLKRQMKPVDPRERTFIDNVKMPRNFSWLIPTAVCGLSIPKRNNQIQALRQHHNLRTIVTIFDGPLPDTLFDGANDIERVFLRVPNYGAPSVAQIDEYLKAVERTINSGGAVAVHCGGGKGRAGTLLASYLIKHGLNLPRREDSQMGTSMTVGEALELLRRLRPGSVESNEQEKALKEYADHLWQSATSQIEVIELEASAVKPDIDRYPSTPHLPFSPEVHSDDVKLSVDSIDKLFIGKEVVITEKLDGGNCCLHNGSVYARTHSQEATHPSFGPVKSLYMQFAHEVPSDLLLFGENMVGIHSIEYDNLQSYFYLFSVYRIGSGWFSWDAVLDLAKKYSLPTVPERFRGKFTSSAQIKKWMDSNIQAPSSIGKASRPEGFVIRLLQEFSTDQFEMCVAKYVRAGHIQTDDTWTRTWKKASIIASPDATSSSKQPSTSTSTSTSTTSTSTSTSTSKTAGSSTSSTKNSSKAASTIENKQIKTKGIKMILLVGIPGSGKSTFAKKLEAKGGATWVHVCQDDLGSKQVCEEKVAKALLGKNSHKKVILDRCNVTPEERKYWMSIGMLSPKETIVIHFDVTTEECKSRVLVRQNHPTIPMGRGETVIQSFAKQFIAPKSEEGFADIVKVSTFEDVETLLLKISKQ